jgi:phage tail tape-measure protein
MKKEKDNKTAEQQTEENENTGRLSGLGAGVITGAAIGSTIVPVVGTFAGALVGGVVGSEVGKKFGGKLLDRLGSKKSETAGKTDVTAELERLAALHKQGILDDDEFKAAKASLLNL